MGASMIAVRRAHERGHATYQWLTTYHTFSFNRYYDAKHMGFRSLRVINEDRIAPGTGFATHPHRDMEIITYVLEGALEHRDSMGEQTVIRPGDVQRISAGTGITHSEYNHSRTEAVHLLQIWILPDEIGLTPGYAGRAFGVEEKRGRWQLIASRGPNGGAVHINQDARLYATVIAGGEEISYDLEPGRHAWLQMARGEAALNGVDLNQGDGVAVSEERTLRLVGTGDAEALLFDLA